MTTTGPLRNKVDRDEVFLEYTRSICPVWKIVVDGQVNVRDGKVFLRKRCPHHGPFEALLSSDAQLYFDPLRFNKPGTIPLETQTEVKDGCPLDCGLCPEHKQHACLGGMGHPAVKGVAFQPVTHSGRHVTFDPANRVTNADVIHALADQLPDWFRVSDFVPVPCCFPTCRSMTYALVDGDTVVPRPASSTWRTTSTTSPTGCCPPPPSARRWRSCGAPPPSPAAPAPTTNSTSWAAGPPAVRA